MNKNNSAIFDTTILQDKLEKNLGDDVVIEKKGENNELPWNIKKNNYKFQITTKGDVIQIAGITLSQTELQMIAGQEPVALTATLTEGIEGKINWVSSDTSVATVDNGIVTSVGESGTAIITASVTSGGVTYEAKCSVIIIQRVTSITVEDMEIGKGNIV